MRTITILVLYLFLPVVGYSGIITVPYDYPTIQSAIDMSWDGDIIQVIPNTYYENIDYMGKEIQIMGLGGATYTCIDGSRKDRVVNFGSWLGSGAALYGFTICNGEAYEGGGIDGSHSSPRVSHCIIQNNRADNGGGIHFSHGSPIVTDCIFKDNHADYAGGGMTNHLCSPLVQNCIFQDNGSDYMAGGMWNIGAHPTVDQCIFQDNWAASYGGGMYNQAGAPTVIQCTFVGNWSYGGGIYNMYDSAKPIIIQCIFYGNRVAIFNDEDSKSTVINCILWNLSYKEIMNDGGGSAVVTHTCIQGGHSGTGNIDSDPLFVDPESCDFHLSLDSPCIDAGDNSAPNLPEFDFEGDARIFDGNADGVATVDMGIDEFRPGNVWIDDDWAGSSYGDPVEGHIFGFNAFDKIQDGIHQIAGHGCIRVADGVYAGTGNREIDFLGRPFTLRSDHGPESCIIDCEASGRGFHFHNKEGADSVVDGFTIKNGYSNEHGGGMLIESASPTITDCIFQGNTAIDYGGGIHNDHSSPTIIRSVFLENSAYRGGGVQNTTSSPFLNQCSFQRNEVDYGGGVDNLSDSSATLTNCIFHENTAAKEAGGIFNYIDCSIDLKHCTFYGNSSVHGAGAIVSAMASTTITNSIFWNDSPKEIIIASGGTYSITYSCIEGGFTGTGNIDSDPLLVDPVNGDLHLRYTSPCRDMGDNAAPGLPAEDFEGDPRIADGTVDMGVDEFYLHLYYTGDATPGATFNLNFIGIPASTPVQLWFGAGVMDPGLPTPYGEWCLDFPLFFHLVLGSIPGPDGVLTLPCVLPPDTPVPLDLPLQAGIGMQFSNLCIVEVK